MASQKIISELAFEGPNALLVFAKQRDWQVGESACVNGRRMIVVEVAPCMTRFEAVTQTH